ncbi:MAG: hypothetical protein JWP37_339 [Mucilaginibacter sp.]|nr:hypothetical protein [Mucilaginibacter sp.]
MIATFKNLADQANSSVDAFKNDFEALRNHYGITGDYFSSSMVIDKIQEEIDDQLKPASDATCRIWIIPGTCRF